MRRAARASALLGGCLIALLAPLPPTAVQAVPAQVSGTHLRGPRRAHPARRLQRRALKMIWGPLKMPDGASAFPIYHRLGVQVLQLQLSWAKTAPTRPTNPANPADPAYHWPASLAQAVAQATPDGIAIALMVKETPPWANGGRAPSWAPENPADYASFLQAAAARYPQVRYWMIWGEVTRAGNFNPMPAHSPVGPRRYALLLQSAYTALKAANTSNVVIGGMTYTVGLDSPYEFLKYLRLPNGQPPQLDYYGQNPYSVRFPNLGEGPYAPGVSDINDIDTLHQQLEVTFRHRPGGPPKLWLSEFSVSSDHPNRAFSFAVSRPAQARWVSAAFRLVNSVPYVAGLGWYQLLDEPLSVAGNLTNGLMTAGGQPKPAFYAYATAP